VHGKPFGCDQAEKGRSLDPPNFSYKTQNAFLFDTMRIS